MAKTNKKRKQNPKLNLFLLNVLGMLITFAPIAVELVMHKDVYFASKAAGWSLTIGGIVAVLLIALAMLGKLGKLLGSEIKVIGVICVLSMLLEPILLNLKLLSFLLLAGMSVSGVFIKPKIRKLQRRIKNEETASVLKEALNG